jgi:hypothetical protein
MRQVTQHDWQPSLLDNGDRGIEIVYSEEKKYFVMGRLGQQRQNKISCTGKTSPTNQPRKEHFHLTSLSPRSPQFQQSAKATPLWSVLVSLVTSLNTGLRRLLDEGDTELTEIVFSWLNVAG